MGDDQLRLYRTLSRAPFPKSYVGKVFLTAFFGTHVPLLALLVYFVRDFWAIWFSHHQGRQNGDTRC
jgi:hypothetical protein